MRGVERLGELGNGTTTDSASAVSVVGLGTGVSTLAAGPDNTCVIDNGGTQCWGFGLYGDLGNNSTTDTAVPVTVDFPSQSINQNLISFWAGARARSRPAMSGAGAPSIMYFGIAPADPWIPNQVPGLPAAAQAVVGGPDATCALVGGEAWCWGRDYEGALGDGTTTDTFTATRVAGLSGITQLSIGENHGCAVANGAAYCWGGDAGGEIGNGVHNSTIYEATQVTGLSSGVTQISQASTLAARWSTAAPCAGATTKKLRWETSA